MAYYVPSMGMGNPVGILSNPYGVTGAMTQLPSTAMTMRPSPVTPQASSGFPINAGTSILDAFLMQQAPTSTGAVSSAASTGAHAVGTGASSGGSAGLGSVASAAFSNPWSALVGAALAGATALSADSAAAGEGGQEEKWLGPAYTIPRAIAEGDWNRVASASASPLGAIYNIATGQDTGKSIAEAFGPLGTIPYALFSGEELPFSGGDSSKSWINLFSGLGF
jgi:hypothetical protein